MSMKRDYERSDLVTIYVGPTRQKHTAHKDIITKVDYFAKCLKNFEESETLKITLPEDNPEVFEKLLEYIYCGHIKAETFDNEKTRELSEEQYIMLLVNIYIDADKYCMEACQNHLMDFFFQYFRINCPMPCTIVELGKRGLRTCNLRKFLINDLCYTTKDSIFRANTIHNEEIMELIATSGDDAEDIFTACVRRSIDGNNSNDRGVECDWHTHNITEKCIKGSE